MDYTISLPKLSYGNHETIRQEYKYADDLVNQHNWKNEMSEFSGRINEYIDQRDRFADVRSRNLREIGLPMGEARKSMDVFQTLSGDILNNYFFINIGKTIKGQYEHYSKPTGAPIPGASLKINYLDVDKIPKELSDYLIEMSSFANTLSSKLSLLVSPDTIEYHKKFIKDNDYTAGRIVGENPDLPKYGLYPEVIGTDIANLTSATNDITSVAFTAGGLFGWRYVTPEQRTVGSAADFGSILIDVLYKISNKQAIINKTGDNEIKGETKKNCEYIFSKIINYYEPLVTSNVIGELSKINEDVGINPTTVPSSRNPFVLGIKEDKYRQPDVYALWCIYRSIRTPFYNRDVIKPDTIDISDDISRLLEFDVKKEGNNLEFFPKTPTFDGAIVKKIKEIKEMVIKVLKTGNDEKQQIPALSLQVGDLVTEYNVPVTENTSLANKSIAVDIVDKLEKLSDSSWFNMITQSFTLLYLNLFIAANVEWKDVTSLSGVEGLNVTLNKVGYKVEGVGFTHYTEYINLVNTANKQFNKYRNTIKSYFGTTSQNPMGGTSLMGSNPISLQRYGTIISYPGDTNILESISGYMTMLLSDINSVEKRLQEALDNMSNMYWYRDVLKWLELLFTIFKPNEVPPGRSSSSSEIKSKFFQLEKILKILYSKQLKIMMDYLQKSKILQKRYETSGRIDTSLEKQIKKASYYTNSTICYIKRQILVIYYLLDKSLESWWTMSPSVASRKRRAVAPAFLESDFKPAYRIMKSSLFEWFRGEVSRLTSTVSDPDMLKEIRTLGKDVCESDKGNQLIKKTVSNVYLQDEVITAIRTDARFWLLLIANLKNKNISNISSKPEELQRLYIPVYEKSGSNRKYYLFDIMPLVLKGNYKGQFGGMSSPQWMTSQDIENTRFTKNNSGIIILANTPNEVAYNTSWKAISIEWFNNLVSISGKVSSEQSNPDKKLWFIRTGISLLLHSQSIYNSPKVQKETLGSKDVDTTRSGDSKLRLILQRYQEYTNSNKETNNKYLMLISREYIKNEMNSSSVQFQTI
jgi:hypothetical protein